MISLSQRQSLLAGLLVLGLLAPLGSSARARGGGGFGVAHGGFSADAIQPHPVGIPSLASRASLGSAALSPVAGGTGMRSDPTQMGQGSHRHHRPPAGGSRGSGTSKSSAASAIDQSAISVPTQTQVPSSPANAGRNPALTGGTDPAIGQPSPPVPDTLASGGGSATVDHYGGGAETLASCMSFWDRGTHMTRAEWRQTYNRTLNGIDLPVEMGGPVAQSSGTRHAAASPHGRRR